MIKIEILNGIPESINGVTEKIVNEHFQSLGERENYLIMNKISFIGLGNMGKPMAFNLLKKKFDIKIYDINKNYINLLKILMLKLLHLMKNLAQTKEFLSVWFQMERP